ncbi:MAG: hypothetical protein WCO57_15425 [Verrucomicrobiota bacterium]
MRTLSRREFIATSAVASATLCMTGKLSAAEPGKKTFTILHTNDLHSNFIGMAPATDYSPFELNNDTTRGGYARLFEQQQPVTPVFVVLLAFWLAMLFLSFGLFAPRNATVSAVLLVCAFSVSSAVFLILEMSHPLDGFIKVSSAPLLKALELIGH